MGDEDRITRLERQIDRLNTSLERARFHEYVDELDRPKRMIFKNLLGGLAKGLGMAIGFALLGALFMAMLTWLANANLPIIGKFIAKIVNIVKTYSK